MTRRMVLGPGPHAQRLAVALWMLRALWLLMLLSPMVLYACATVLTDRFNDAIAKGHPSIRWVDEPPLSIWLVAAVVVLGGMLIPPVLERRSVARLRPRIERAVDPSRPGSYRGSPRIVPECSDAVIEAACARYAGRLALSFAMLGAVVLLFLWGFMYPRWDSGLGFAHHYFWRPVDYVPGVLLVSIVIAAQFPTMRRMLRSLQIEGRINGSS